MDQLIRNSELADIYEKVLAGVRLYESPRLAYVGDVANTWRV